MTIDLKKARHETLRIDNLASDNVEAPLITVITAVFNAERTIRDCIESVLRQGYSRIEHIIVDGGSTDGTLEVLRNYNDKLAMLISEPDSGVYDAWNKGIRFAHGEWIAFLGGDDQFLPGAIQAYVDLARSHPEADFLSSVVRWDYRRGYSRLLGEEWQWPRFLKFMCAAHPGSMHRRSFFKTYGVFDTSYKIAADYELLLRPRATLKAAYMPMTTVAMRAGGISDSFAALREASRARVETGGRELKREAVELRLSMLKLLARRLFLALRAKLPA